MDFTKNMRILIIGKNSYIGNHIDEWLSLRGYKVDQLEVRSDRWKTYDYSPYDVIIYVAAIVHRPDCKDWNLYKHVNADIPVEIAKKAKSQHVKHYIYFSTMGVYDVCKNLRPTVIDENTPMLCDETYMYGMSKLKAEQELTKLLDADFNISMVRPPSVYGKGCKGGYITGFKSIVKLLPILPRAYSDVRQSFIYIDNLSECVRLIIEKGLTGVFCPQDDYTPNANELFEAIAEGLGKKYHDSKILGFCVRIFGFIPLVRKVYGGIEYSRSVSDISDCNYCVVSFKEGIKRTVL